MIGGWFVTGTDTGVGKTCVAEALLQGLAHGGRRATGMKPVASGCRRTPAGLRSEDAERLQAAASVVADYIDTNPYALEAAIAPHLAAARAGTELRLDVVQHHFQRLAAAADWLVVEGVGGWRVPFDRTLYQSDVARVLGLPVILVVRLQLGCINHALLTAEAIRADGSNLAGWVANSIDATFAAGPETVAALRERIPASLLATVPPNAGPAEWRALGAALTERLTGDS